MTFASFFDNMMEKHTLKFNKKELNHMKGGNLGWKRWGRLQSVKSSLRAQ